MEIYESEEQQLEALKRWWQNNGNASLVGLGLGVAIILGWNYWQDYKKSRMEQASNLYVELTKAATASQAESVDKLAERLQNDFASTPYTAYGHLIQAKFKADQGQLAEARKILEPIAALPNPELGNVAKIRIVRLMMANKEFEPALKLINEVDPASSKQFANEYDELVGDLYVALDRPEQARTAYLKAQENGHQSPLLQAKIDDLTPPEKIGAAK